MGIALLIARVLLAAVFVVAGLSKLADRAGSRQALIDFGVPARLATPGGILLPLAELAVAVALIPLATAWWGAVGALVLVLLFIAGIVYNLARGRTPDCHCFGQLYSKPIGWSTLLRNLLLAALAGFIVVFGWSSPGLSAVAWFGDLALAQRLEVIVGVLILAFVIGAGWLLLAMMRQQGRLLLRIEALEERLATGGEGILTPVGVNQAQAGLPMGAQAPTFALSGLFGETNTLDALRAVDKPIVLLFTDPGCGPCTALLPEVGRWQRDYTGKLILAIISRGTPEANRAKFSEHGITGVLLQKDREIALAYQANGTPAAVLVRPEGTIGSPLATGAEAIRALVAQAVGLPALRSIPAVVPANGSAVPMATAQNGNSNQAHTASQPSTTGVGDQAPSFALPNLGGRTVHISDFRGNKVLVLFWNPGCGFCERMLDDLKAWEANPPKGAPRLLVVSTGTVETNQGIGLRSPVLLDQNMSTGSKFGANGTPMAVLIDAQGRIASELAAGGPAVLALARSEQLPTLANKDAVQPASPMVGKAASPFALPDLRGKMVNLSDFLGKKTVLLFWDPACGFCGRMLPDLKAWEGNHLKDAPRLLVVSKGTVEANQALGLRSPIVLDQNMSVGGKFGANGTPMAVLIDENGAVASELAIGAPAVLTLADSV